MISYKQSKGWLWDKWAWLKSFNRPTEITICADVIKSTKPEPIFRINGRLSLVIYSDIEAFDRSVIVSHTKDDINNDKPVNR